MINVLLLLFWTFDVWYVLPRLAPGLREDFYWLVAIWLIGAAGLELFRGYREDVELPGWLDNPKSYTELTDGSEFDQLRD